MGVDSQLNRGNAMRLKRSGCPTVLRAIAPTNHVRPRLARFCMTRALCFAIRPIAQYTQHMEHLNL